MTITIEKLKVLIRDESWADKITAHKLIELLLDLSILFECLTQAKLRLMM